MRRSFLTLAACLALGALAACADGAPDTAAARPDTLTRRQRDSIVGASSLPGAKGVQNAIRASDAAAARAAQHDSLPN